MLEEIFPAIAYYQDTWGATLDRVRVAGFGSRERNFAKLLPQELKSHRSALAESPKARMGSIRAKNMIQQELDALVGWMTRMGRFLERALVGRIIGYR